MENWNEQNRDPTIIHYQAIPNRKEPIAVNNAVPVNKKRCLSPALADMDPDLFDGNAKCYQCNDRISDSRFQPKLALRVLAHGTEQLKSWLEENPEESSQKQYDRTEFIHLGYICATPEESQPSDPEQQPEEPGCMGTFCPGCRLLSISGIIRGHIKYEDEPPARTSGNDLPAPRRLADLYCWKELRRVRGRVGPKREGEPVPICPERGNANFVCAFVGCSRNIWEVGQERIKSFSEGNGRWDPGYAESDVRQYLQDVAQCEDQACNSLYCFDCYENQKWGVMNPRYSHIPEKVFRMHYRQGFILRVLVKSTCDYLTGQLQLEWSDTLTAIRAASMPVEEDPNDGNLVTADNLDTDKRKREPSTESEVASTQAEDSKRAKKE